MTFDEITRKRRAINFFDPDRDVSDDLLNQMIDMASRAPSSFNLQPWNLVVLRNRAEKEKLKKLAWDQPKVVEAPVVLIVLADRNGWQAGHPTLEKNWQTMVETGVMKPEQHDWFVNATKSLYNWNDEADLAFAVKNAGFFAMALMHAATSLGLETHPMDGFEHDNVREAFNIPSHFWLPLLLAVGYQKPGKTTLPPKWRKSREEIILSFT